MEATGDRPAGTQSRRGSPAKQRSPATRATGVRRSYRRLAETIPPVVRDTPHGWAAPRAAAQRRWHVVFPMDTCGDTVPARTPGLVCRDTAFPSTCGSGLRGTSNRAVGGTGRPLGKTLSLHCQSILSSRRYLPAYPFLFLHLFPCEEPFPPSSLLPSFSKTLSSAVIEWHWERSSVMSGLFQMVVHQEKRCPFPHLSAFLGMDLKQCVRKQTREAARCLNQTESCARSFMRSFSES